MFYYYMNISNVYLHIKFEQFAMLKIQRLKYIAFSIICFTAITGNAQTYKSSNWTTHLMLGFSNLRGDLGGSNFIGSEGIFNYDLRASRLAVGTGIGMIRGPFSVGINIIGTRLLGDDAYTTKEFEKRRNLSVKTDLIEASLIGEWRPFSRNIGFNRFYIYGGIGGIYYQPKGLYNNEWIKLRTLGTEGQYLEDGDGPYSELDLVIPFGLGYKFKIGKSTSLVVEFGARKTFTDYLDDVSTVYADPVLLAEASGDLSPLMADKSATPQVTGSKRGDPEKNDHYLILGFKLEYILGGKAGDGCYYNRNPPKTRSTRINQRRMFTR